MRLCPVTDRMSLPIQNLPESPGVYGLFRRGLVVYIGTSKNIFRRCYDHRSSPCFQNGATDEVRFLLCDDHKARYAMEWWLIAKHKPQYNANQGGKRKSMHLVTHVHRVKASK